jgi:hypothetical protein
MSLSSHRSVATSFADVDCKQRSGCCSTGARRTIAWAPEHAFTVPNDFESQGSNNSEAVGHDETLDGCCVVRVREPLRQLL